MENRFEYVPRGQLVLAGRPPAGDSVHVQGSTLIVQPGKIMLDQPRPAWPVPRES
jgi:RNase P/RNase MRP subunit p29